MRSRVALAVAVVTVGCLAAACRLPAAGPSAGAGTPGAAPSGQATQELAGLRIAPDGSMAGYSRAQFGDGWETQPDHCDSRVDVLKSQGSGVATHGCTVTGGHWLSLYDGTTVTNPHQLDIDHLVPLAEAWRTGAAHWSKQRREAFANDVRLELVAVTAHSNRSKGDDPPPGYEPPNRAEDCSYATRWIQVKVTYQLTVTQTEHDALAAMLTTCH